MYVDTKTYRIVEKIPTGLTSRLQAYWAAHDLLIDFLKNSNACQVVLVHEYNLAVFALHRSVPKYWMEVCANLYENGCDREYLLGWLQRRFDAKKIPIIIN